MLVLDCKLRVLTKLTTLAHLFRSHNHNNVAAYIHLLAGYASETQRLSTTKIQIYHTDLHLDFGQRNLLHSLYE